ncbi:uncharacterized protein LOC125780145 [Bactrocera dorsalis]|uniref:Uncharacterized protein LOC125780145 n=1 Tax=Bactrocera dorsalis TaxID=27457 RepID=A0ABM3K8F7_BACDO|nr:uncharacterized protein LOC125780145 [Bactrocera dorsalis]
MDRQAVLTLNIRELQQALCELNISTTGRKADLPKRLLLHHGHETQEDDEIADSVSSYDDVPNANFTAAVAPIGRSVFTFNDIQESLTQFSGDDNIDIQQWINDFEENALVVGWNSVQKFIYSKQLLKGAAKSFIRSQRGLVSWESLKEELISEFGKKVSSSEVHSQLRSRKKRINETFREYLYVLTEIGKPVNIDTKSLISYFIEGIIDTKLNKAVLYEAKTISELKDKIKVYEKIHSKAEKSTQKVVNTTYNQKVSKSCFRCGSSTHLIRDCSSQQTKCFKCNGIGHKSFECNGTPGIEVKKESDKINVVNIDKSKTSLPLKIVKVGGLKVDALVDTGCCLCLIRSDVFKKIKFDGEVGDDKRTLYGAGAEEFSTYGSVVAELEVDGLKFLQKFHITSETAIPYSVFIGTSVLDKVNINIKPEGAEFIGRSNVEQEVEENRKEKRIELLKEFQELCLSAGEYSNDVVIQELINSYKSNERALADLLGQLVRGKNNSSPGYSRGRLGGSCGDGGRINNYGGPSMGPNGSGGGGGLDSWGVNAPNNWNQGGSSGSENMMSLTQRGGGMKMNNGGDGGMPQAGGMNDGYGGMQQSNNYIGMSGDNPCGYGGMSSNRGV